MFVHYFISNIQYLKYYMTRLPGCCRQKLPAQTPRIWPRRRSYTCPRWCESTEPIGSRARPNPEINQFGKLRTAELIKFDSYKPKLSVTYEPRPMEGGRGIGPRTARCRRPISCAWSALSPPWDRARIPVGLKRYLYCLTYIALFSFILHIHQGVPIRGQI